MTVTFYDDLSGADLHANLVLALRIEGIPIVLVERAIPVASAPEISGYTQFACITRVEEGEATLDLEERREIGATLDIDMLDDDARTLSALFAVNTRRHTWVTSDVLVGGTTLSVQTTTGLANGQTIYTDSETITIGTVASSTSLTGCTRAAFGSTAAALFGAAGNGNSIYTVPPSWVARRACLYGYALTSDGRASGQLLGTWIVDESPRCLGDGFWSLRCAGVAQEIYDRSIGVGLREAKPTGEFSFGTSSGRQTVTLTVDDATGFRLGSSFPSYVSSQTKKDDDSIGFAIFELQSVTTPPGTQKIGVFLDGTPWTPIDIQRRSDGVRSISTTLKPIAIVSGGPLALLYVLMSKEGQGATTYDRLPGRLATTEQNTSWRLGAGLTSSEVDTAAFEAINESQTSAIIIDGEQALSNVLKEWCLLNGVATRITVDGKLAPFSLSPERASSITIGPDDVIPDSRIEVQSDETALTPLASVKCGYNPAVGDYGVELELINIDLSKRYRRNQARRELEFRSIGCSDGKIADPAAPPFFHPASLTVGEIAALTDDIMRGDNGLARRYVSLSLTMAHLDLRIGDVVTLSASLPTAFSTLPDLRGGTIGGKRGRVVSRRPRYDAARIDVRFLILDPLLVVAPASTITAISSTTISLATTTDEVSGSSPANDFIVGAKVRIYDVSAGAVHVTTVSSIPSATQIVVAAAPTFAGGVETGVDYVVLDPAASAVGGTSPNGYTMSEFATLANDAGIVTASNSEVSTSPRWR